MFLCVLDANSRAEGLDEFDALITAIAVLTIGSAIVFCLAIRGERKTKEAQSLRPDSKHGRSRPLPSQE